jgi:hypothetical protein
MYFCVKIEKYYKCPFPFSLATYKNKYMGLTKVNTEITVPLVSSGVSWRFIMSGTEGPYTSVSSRPTTLLGSTDFSATERLTKKKQCYHKVH